MTGLEAVAIVGLTMMISLVIAALLARRAAERAQEVETVLAALEVELLPWQREMLKALMLHYGTASVSLHRARL